MRAGDRVSGSSGLRNVTVRTGDDLEHRIARLLIQQGHFVRRGREIYTVGRLDQATDIDVLAIRFDSTLRRHVTVCECKSGNEGPLDRVFWLAGVKKYTSADRAILVRRATKWNIKDFAKEAGVEILSLDLLADAEKNANVEPAAWPGLSDKAFLDARCTDWNRILQREQHLAELYATLVGETRFAEPFGKINYLIHHARALTKDLPEPGSPRRGLVLLILSEAAAQLAIHLVGIVSAALDLVATDRKAMVARKLQYGELDPRLAERVFGLAYRLAGHAASHYANAPVAIDKNLFVMPTPDYAEALTQLIEDLAAKPLLSETLVPMLDLLLVERLVKDAPAVRLSHVFPYSDLIERIGVVARYLRCLIELKCLPAEALRVISAVT